MPRLRPPPSGRTPPEGWALGPHEQDRRTDWAVRRLGQRGGGRGGRQGSTTGLGNVPTRTAPMQAPTGSVLQYLWRYETTRRPTRHVRAAPEPAMPPKKKDEPKGKDGPLDPTELKMKHAIHYGQNTSEIRNDIGALVECFVSGFRDRCGELAMSTRVGPTLRLPLPWHTRRKKTKEP
jgi:hypothetical protein